MLEITQDQACQIVKNFRQLYRDNISNELLELILSPLVVKVVTDTDLDEKKKMELFDKMHRYGGSFASRFSEAWFFADDSNRKRLEEAFPELIEKYAAKSPTD